MRTEVFIQFIMPGDRDDYLELPAKVAQILWDHYGADPVSVKLESVDDDEN